MTEKQKEWIKKYHSRFPAEYMIGETRPKSAAQKEIEELFPEAFAEPKPERESIDVRIESNLQHISLDNIRHALMVYFKHFPKFDVDVYCLPKSPEGNYWTDELVSKFVDEWESYEGKRFADCMEDFKKKNNIE